MPLRDHFHPPLQLQYPWDSFHSSWATRLADALNDEWLPPEFLAVEHTHTGTELTCVLKGSFSHQGGRFGPGDFDYGDDDIDHRPIVGDEGPCLCLVAMTGDLRMNGFLGRLIGPFVRL